jgi:glutamyl-tRNA synthetase
LEQGISIIQGKVKTVPELIDQLHCLFGDDPVYDTSGLKPEDRTRYQSALNEIHSVIAGSDFSRTDLEAKVKAFAEAKGQKLSPFAQALRFAVTGGKVSPGLFEMLEVQSKPTVDRRIALALKALSQS